MAYDVELADRVSLAFERAGAEYFTKKMMGGLCFMVDDKMTLAVISDELMVRLSPEAAEKALEDHLRCRPMDFTGKPLKGFLYVEADAVNLSSQLDHWVREVLAFNPFAKRSKKRKKLS